MGIGYSWRQVQFPHSLLSPSTAKFFVGTWRRRHYCHCHHDHDCHHHHHHHHDCHHDHQDDHPEAWKNKRSRKESRDGGTSDGRDEERLDQCFRLVRQICPIYFHDLSLGAVDVSYFRSSDKVCVCVCVCVWGGGVTINELMSFCVLIFHDWTRASYEQRPHFHTFLMILIPALMSVTKQLQALHKSRQPEEKRIR